jgi:hypothetical protein
VGADVIEVSTYKVLRYLGRQMGICAPRYGRYARSMFNVRSRRLERHQERIDC